MEMSTVLGANGKYSRLSNNDLMRGSIQEASLVFVKKRVVIIFPGTEVLIKSVIGSILAYPKILFRFNSKS